VDDPESGKVWVNGFIVRELSRRYSSHRASEGLDRYLREAGVPGIQGIDTRALVRHIRDKGAMKAVISTDGTSRAALEQQLAEWPGMSGRGLVKVVTTKERYVYAEPSNPRASVAVVDGGVKRNILRLLSQAGLRVEVFPCDSSADDWMKDNDFVFLSNGPGDPAALDDMVAEIKKVVGTKPIVGICLGHQLLGRALGADTFKLGFGHRGANHPVRDLETGRVEITSQNHGFCVDTDGIKAAGGVPTHINLNDQTLAGFKHEELRIAAVQFHPEASPGPHDSAHLVLERFLEVAGVSA
jgi:carbamoyl-phosphate synthase small subunit